MKRAIAVFAALALLVGIVAQAEEITRTEEDAAPVFILQPIETEIDCMQGDALEPICVDAQMPDGEAVIWQWCLVGDDEMVYPIEGATENFYTPQTAAVGECFLIARAFGGQGYADSDIIHITVRAAELPPEPAKEPMAAPEDTPAEESETIADEEMADTGEYLPEIVPEQEETLTPMESPIPEIGEEAVEPMEDAAEPADEAVEPTEEAVESAEDTPEPLTLLTAAGWDSFRGSDTNMAITQARTPTAADSASLIWSKKLGEGWSSAPSVQIIADDALIVMCADKRLYKLDLQTGETLASAQMAAAPNWGYTPPAYADGLIVCPLENGTLQAFDAVTLEAVWLYTDPDGGQSLSPISYSDGCVYTGFWNSYTASANFVCIDVSDDRSDAQKTEGGMSQKTANWSSSNNGGYYWAGSVAVGGYVIVGGDDGEKTTGGSSAIRCYDKKTGELVCALALTGLGDQRSSLAYSDGRLYFTTAEGWLCSAEIDAETGALNDLRAVKNMEAAQSTSTPIVYEGKVYYGVGSGYSAGEQQRFVCADAETLEGAYSVNLKGYPQCSFLLSTAYEDSGYLYFYATYNNKPGGISLVKVKKDAKSAADTELIELYDAAGYEEYCIASVICGDDGTLYYKNDSGNVFAVGTPNYGRVIQLIDAVGTINAETLDTAAQYALIARSAYKALPREDQEKVTNLQKLFDAETQIFTLHVAEADRLIGLIPTSIGADNRSVAQAIVNAAQAYVNKLSVEECRAVKSLARMDEAQRQINAKTPKGKTKSVRVNSKSGGYRVSAATKRVIKQIDAMQTDPDKMLEAALAYNRLSTDEKLFVSNRAKLENGYLYLASVNHADAVTGARLIGKELAWHLRMDVTEYAVPEDMAAGIRDFLMDNGFIAHLYGFMLSDALSDADMVIAEPIPLILPTKMMENRAPIVFAFDTDGTLDLLRPEMLRMDASGNEIGMGNAYLTDDEQAETTPCLKFPIIKPMGWYGIVWLDGTWDAVLSGEIEINFNALPENWLAYLEDAEPAPVQEKTVEEESKR